MDNPPRQIEGVIKALTEGSNEQQEEALKTYFLPNAYFVHPFCRVPAIDPRTVWLPLIGNFNFNSRGLLLLIYKWYHILSPKITLEVDSTAFDKRTNLLYATIRQTFTLWFVPFSLWQANVQLVCLLELAHLHIDDRGRPTASQASNGEDDDTALSGKKRYFIRGQQDHYQVNEFVKFVAPFGAATMWYVWQIIATLVCAVGVAVFWPFTATSDAVIAEVAQIRGKKRARE
ncbi:hypothetical protein F5Y16DRAFT_372773 [Xylariaceae sp. FL0255]|nr:hypothetical protein F5Y16DRAFT_372773 [Xylariaceae sp. FL0255]